MLTSALVVAAMPPGAPVSAMNRPHATGRERGEPGAIAGDRRADGWLRTAETPVR